MGRAPGRSAAPFRDSMPSRWRWILVVTGATALDLLARVAAAFDLGRVLHIEAVLFPVTALVLATLLKYDQSARPLPHAVQVSLVWLFGLGGLRPVLWTLGLPLMVANFATLVPAVVGIVVWRLRRRHRMPGQPLGGSSEGKV